MIFNELPSKQDIEMMEKMHKKYGRQVDIAAIFLKRFKVEKNIGFPYQFSPNERIICASGERQFKKKYFLLLRENRVNYIDSLPHPQVLAFLLDKNLKGKVTDDFLKNRSLKPGCSSD